MFYRVSTAVIAPNLMQDLNLNAEMLGILGGAFFYSFALLQIPIGPMLDRMGPRIIVTLFPIIGALGSFLFAFGNSFKAVLLGRVLIGVGMTPILMGTLKVYTFRFRPDQFATLVGTTLSVGTLGTILAASPLAYLAHTIGWRMTFVLTGFVTICFALSVSWALGGEEKKENTIASSSSFKPDIGILQSLQLILRSLSFWQIGATAFFRSGTFFCLQGLWLGPYLMDTKAYSSIQTGNVLSLLAVGTIIGGPVSGRLSDKIFRSRKKVALGGLSLYTFSLLPLLGILNIQSPIGYALIFLLIGFFNGFGMVVFSHAKELFPIHISGTVMAGVNFFSQAGVAVFMPALGKIIECFPRMGHVYPAKAYHLAFLICFLGMVVSVIFYAFSRPSFHKETLL